MKDKIFVIYDYGVWNDEQYHEIIGATENKEDAFKIIKEYIAKTKEEIDFKNLDVINEDDDLDYSETEGEWIYSENENHFSLYLDGEYNSNNININIDQVSLYKDLDNEVEK